jgi:hypothetical protein
MVLFGSSSPLSLELWFEGQKYAYIGREVREYRLKLIIDVGNGCAQKFIRWALVFGFKP